MKTSLLNLGLYPRLALLLLVLAAQGFASAHDIDDSHALKSDLCSACVIGHGLGAAVSVSYETPTLQAYQPQAPVHSIAATPTYRANAHFARAPPIFSWNT
jgi:hypothetical protein